MRRPPPTPAALARAQAISAKLSVARLQVRPHGDMHSHMRPTLYLGLSECVARLQRRRTCSRYFLGVLPLSVPACLIAYLCGATLYSAACIGLDPRVDMFYQIPFILAACVGSAALVWGVALYYSVRELQVRYDMSICTREYATHGDTHSRSGDMHMRLSVSPCNRVCGLMHTMSNNDPYYR